MKPWNYGYRKRKSYVKRRRNTQPAKPVPPKPGSYGKPLSLNEGTKVGIKLKESYHISMQQVRYRGKTTIYAYRKGNEPTLWKDWTGHMKQIGWQYLSEQSYKNFQSDAKQCEQNTKTWYVDPISTITYEQFKEDYVLYESFCAYTD